MGHNYGRDTRVEAQVWWGWWPSLPLGKFLLSWSHNAHSLAGEQTLQRIYKWQNHIGNAAIEALKKLWASDKKYESSKECTTYGEDMLFPTLMFLYGDVEKMNEGTFAVSELWVMHASCDTNPPWLCHCSRSQSCSKAHWYFRLWLHTSRTLIQSNT